MQVKSEPQLTLLERFAEGGLVKGVPACTFSLTLRCGR